jgi:hypothetical protein
VSGYYKVYISRNPEKENKNKKKNIKTRKIEEKQGN